MSAEDDAEIVFELVANGYRNIRRLPTGEWAAVLKFIFTWGLCVGLDRDGYRTRFCFETREEATNSLNSWDGKGFPPGWWLRQKPENVNNPLRTEQEPQHRALLSSPPDP
jgi:hypothetical protein